MNKDEMTLHVDKKKQTAMCKMPMAIMTSRYNCPGKADEQVGEAERLSCLAKAQLAYFRGNDEECLRWITACRAEDAAFFEQVGLKSLMVLCALCRGDVSLWREGMQELEDIRCGDDSERKLKEFWKAAAASAIYADDGFPDYFCRGCLDMLPSDTLPVARVFYARYLHIKCRDIVLVHGGKRGTYEDMVWMMPHTCELLLSETRRERAVLPQIYLHLLSAVSYHWGGGNDLAREHIDRAAELALPDRLYGPLAEYRIELDFLMDEELNKMDPAALRKVRQLSKRTREGWVTVHNEILGRTVSAELTIRERETAKLAAMGFTTAEIAARLHLSESTVKMAIARAMEKTGVKARRELLPYI